MKHKTALVVSFILLVPLVFVFAITLAAGSVQTGDPSKESLAPVIPFTYQGELTDNGDPEPGPCDFDFGLYGAPSMGVQIGVTQTITSVTLYDGRFTVMLNTGLEFTPFPFDGSPRFLAIAVDCPTGTGSYTSLSPRQLLTPAPYAHFAFRAGSVPWTNIAGKPIDFADGVDDDTQYLAGTGLDLITPTFQLEDSYQLPQGCITDQVVEWDGLAWACVTPGSGGASYANVVVVAKSGEDYDTVQGALDSISGAHGDSRYLVWVAPGVYSETVTMKMWVDIEGAGRDLTKIKSVGAGSSTYATVQAAEHSQLRYLTVENIGGDSHAIAIRSDDDDFGILGVTVLASGGTDTVYGISIIKGPFLNRVDDTMIIVDAHGTSQQSYGIRTHASYGYIELIFDDVTIDIEGASDTFIHGYYQTVNADHSAAITATNMVVNAVNSGTGLSSRAYAVYATGSENKVFISDSYLNGSSPNDEGTGFLAISGAYGNLRNVVVEGNTYGVWLDSSTTDPSIVEINSSQVRGGTYSANLDGTATNELYVGASLLEGFYDISATSTMTCVGSYDETYVNTNGFTVCP